MRSARVRTQTMAFVAECAARLDAGESSDSVMRDVRQRYTTVTCLNSKLSQVRSLCRPSDAYQEAVADALVRADGEETRSRIASLAAAGGRLRLDDSEAVRTAVRSLPPRLTDNVRALRLSRHELRECKRVQAAKAIEKNMARVAVCGRTLLAHARAVVAHPTEVRGGIPELTLALMLVTGRRECEVLNGRSAIAVHTTHSLTFRGQAKKRDGGDPEDEREERVVPCLASAREVVECLAHLRTRQRHAVASNEETSRRYQSYLSRHMRSVSPWMETRTHVHSLRGIYTCMAHALFDWGLHTDAYVSMCILGHTSLAESLVYTTFDLGRAFLVHEPSLGRGHLTPHRSHPSPCAPTSAAPADEDPPRSPGCSSPDFP